MGNDLRNFMFQKYVEEDELKHILNEMNEQKNLFFCLGFGKSHPKYEEKLMLVCQKLAFISSLFFIETVRDLCDSPYSNYPIDIDYEVDSKLPYEDYYQFFEEYAKDIQDAKVKLFSFKFDKSTVGNVYNKYNLIKEMCVPLLADVNDVYFASQFKSVIEYALEHNSLPDNIKELIKNVDVEYGNFHV